MGDLPDLIFEFDDSDESCPYESDSSYTSLDSSSWADTDIINLQYISEQLAEHGDFPLIYADDFDMPSAEYFKAATADHTAKAAPLRILTDAGAERGDLMGYPDMWGTDYKVLLRDKDNYSRNITFGLERFLDQEGGKDKPPDKGDISVDGPKDILSRPHGSNQPSEANPNPKGVKVPPQRQPASDPLDIPPGDMDINDTTVQQKSNSLASSSPESTPFSTPAVDGDPNSEGPYSLQDFSTELPEVYIEPLPLPIFVSGRHLLPEDIREPTPYRSRQAPAPHIPGAAHDIVDIDKLNRRSAFLTPVEKVNRLESQPELFDSKLDSVIPDPNTGTSPSGRYLLDIKRTGQYKCRGVKQGFKENKVITNGQPEDVKWIFDLLAVRFECKNPEYLTPE
jgi:hypothetical protein